MARQLWLPGTLREAGIDVYVMPGAVARGREDVRFDAIIWHHTATGPNWQDGHVAALLRDGRRDLAGPLAQVGIERDGTWVIVALGRANHNGYGRYGNNSLGLEFYNSGVGEEWPEAQVESGIRGIAAVQRTIGIVPVLGHRESDPKRKIDPFGLNMNVMRSRIAMARRGAASTQVLEDDTMHVELIKMAYRRARGATYDPSVKDPSGWTGWMKRLAAAQTSTARDAEVQLCNHLIDQEIARNRA
jgi:hypothetical protein